MRDPKRAYRQKKEVTHWESSAQWYDKLVGDTGHYYHEHVILPRVLERLKGSRSVLDLACGQGILSFRLPKEINYLGIDAAKTLIRQATMRRISNSHQFLVHDLLTPFKSPRPFTHAACILALQNLSDPLMLFQTAYQNLTPDGTLILVINHPYFRIPRQSSWGIDEAKQCQYRRIDRYMSPLKVPIQTHPGAPQDATQTLSFHFPLSHYVSLLTSAGFSITALEEWCSDKTSTGKHAAMENRSRKEFPLFLCLVAKKT